MEFQIPLSRADLLRPSEGSLFFVSEPLPAREIVSRLEGRPSMLLSFSTAFSPLCYSLISQECRSLLDSSVVASIPECFPVFFSLLQ